MDTKSPQSPTLAPLIEDSFVYVAIKGSLHANDCFVFGLGQEEIKALVKKFPGSGVDIQNNAVNGTIVKTNVIQVINSLALLGYKVISSTGEVEITWTLQREI